MEKLYSVQEIAERYGIQEDTARRWMKEMGALKIRPMKVQESKVIAWEQAKTPQPEEEKPATGRRKKKQTNLYPTPVPPKPGQYISRVRPKAI